MCGILGVYNLKHKNVDAKIVNRMLQELQHRGPDDTGEVLFKTDTKKHYTSDIDSNYGDLSFAHCRLKVIDLSSAGHQPMSNEDKSIWIIFNGMIYNYCELREELKAKGHSFKSSTDTEVIVHAYEEFGQDCFVRFNGMWSLAIWDSRKRVFLCARDRFGVKPFYYFYDGQDFIFASEIKALIKHPKIKKEPNYNTIYNYLSYNFGYTDISDETFFKGIKQILPGEYIIVKDDHLERKIYWDLDFDKNTELSSDEEYMRSFYEIFEDAVRIRLRSDVPMGICLSGGLDSSSVACMIKTLKKQEELTAFTVSFAEKEFDETSYAKKITDYTGIKMQYVFPKAEELFDNLSELIWHQEEPFTNLNIYSQWVLAKEAHKQGIIVLLNGHGGDESLNGYARERYFLLADLIKTLKLPSVVRELAYQRQVNKLNSIDSITRALWLIFSQSVPNSLKDVSRRYLLVKNKCLNKDFVKKHQNYFYLEQKINGFLKSSSYMSYRISPLPGWLHAEDRITMANSIESRSPFLDFRLAQFGVSLPPDQKFRNGISKFILRKAMQGSMPEDVRMRMDKKGYPTPTENWLKGSLHDKALDIFNSSRFIQRGIFNQKEVLSAFNQHCQGKRNLRFSLWSWINLELWFREFFD